MVPVESTDGITYESWATIMAIYDGENGKNGENGKDGNDGENGKDGEDALTLVIVSSNGNYFRNNMTPGPFITRKSVRMTVSPERCLGAGNATEALRQHITLVFLRSCLWFPRTPV